MVDSEAGVASAAPIEWRGHVLSPLRFSDWASLGRQALESFKRDKMQTYREHSELIPEKIRNDEIVKEFRRISELTIADLPRKPLSIYRRDAFGTILRQCQDEDCRCMTIEEECPKCKGIVVPIEKVQMVPYDQWWLSTDEGRLHALHLSIRRTNPSMTVETIDELSGELGKEIAREGADKVADLSRPQMGNC